MNVRGEPIVDTPEQAYNMIVKTDMDYIVMGDYIIKK
jgi:carbamoyltransferase